MNNDQLIEIAKKILPENSIWPLIIVLAVTLISKWQNISDFLETRKKVQINRLMEALNCDHVDETLKNFLKHEIQKEYFQYISNLSVEKIYREKLLLLHERANGDIAFYRIKRAHEYFEFKNGDINIKISLLSKLWCGYNIFTLVVIILCELILLNALFNSAIFDYLIIPKMCVFFIFGIILPLKEIAAFISARKIKQFLEENQHSENLPDNDS